LFDASNNRIQVAAIIFVWALPMACANKSKGNAIVAFFPFEHRMGKW
jgi:hypothetical protein